MLRTSTVLARIRDQCPTFAQIDHALTSSAQNNYPAAFVAIAKMTADPNGMLGVHSQMVRLTLRVYVVVERRQDVGPAFGAADQWDDIVASLRAALKGWTPDSATIWPFDMAGGELSDRDGLACWAEDFTTTIDVRS